jgi:hypothetical protein
MDYSNLFSGLVGALFGIVVTLVLYWHSRYTSAKRALSDRLTILRHDVWWNCTDSEVFKTWDASLKEIWLLYNALFDFALWKRRRIRNAWERYKGVNREVMEKLQGEVFDSKMAPKNKQEFLHIISSFIDAL